MLQGLIAKQQQELKDEFSEALQLRDVSVQFWGSWLRSLIQPEGAARMFCWAAPSSISVLWRMEEDTQMVKEREEC